MIPITHIPITQVAKGIARLGPLETGHRSGPTSPYIVFGKELAMIAEPGQDGQAPQIIEALKQCDISLDKVAYVWASHIHMYHVQGLSVLMAGLPKAKFLVHPRGAPHLVDVVRLMETTKPIWSIETTPQEKGTKCYGAMQPIPADRVQPVEDNQVFDLGEKKVQIIWAPGHAPHHMGLFDLETRALFTGDTAMMGIPGRPRGHHDIRPPLFHVDNFVQTLQRYRALRPSVLLTHGMYGQSYTAEDTLRYCEEDIRAIERICREGMKQKRSFKQIVADVDEYVSKVGGRPTNVEQRPEFTSGGLFGLINYLHRADPDLALPSGATQNMQTAL